MTKHRKIYLIVALSVLSTNQVNSERPERGGGEPGRGSAPRNMNVRPQGQGRGDPRVTIERGDADREDPENSIERDNSQRAFERSSPEHNIERDNPQRAFERGSAENNLERDNPTRSNMRGPAFGSQEGYYPGRLGNPYLQERGGQNEGAPMSPEQLRRAVHQSIQQSQPMQLSNKNFQNSKINSSNFSQIRQNNQIAVNKVQSAVNINYPNYSGWFSTGFYARHGYNSPYGGAWGNEWRGANWGYANGWLGWGFASPIYYDDGGIPYDVPPDQVTNVTVINNPPPIIATPPPTHEQNVASDTSENDWLSMGVFAVGEDATRAAYSNMFLQLSLDKLGNIVGSYYNATTDQIYPVTGIADRDTQQAAWKISNQPDSPVLSTGVYNLTLDATPVQVQFSDNTDQTWTLVRLKNTNS